MKYSKSIVAITCLVTSMTCLADDATKSKVQDLDARMQRIERVIDNQALLTLAQRIENLQREIQELRGENERLAFELNALKARQREQYLELDQRVQNTNGVPVASPDVMPSSTNDTSINNSSSTSTTVATTTGTAVTATGSGDAAQDYKHAFTMLKQAKYDESIHAFSEFLATHPGSKYASNAQYWLAEANYVSKKYPQALTEFKKVVEVYPASSKVADAKLKLGFTYYELKKYEEARIELTKLRAQFPNSTVATLAQQRLDRMSREGH